jgi:S1-C subfamily serine protease
MSRFIGLLVLVLAMQVTFAQLVLPRETRLQMMRAVVAVDAYDFSLGDIAGSGSGTIISPDGFVLTNFHVIGDIETGVALEWHQIYTVDPQNPDLEPTFRYWARFVAGDAELDLAILQIVEDAEEQPLPSGTIFPFLPIGDSNALLPGDPIMVVGFPSISGYTVTFTSGVVSGFVGEDFERSGKRWIKTDAKLAGGNSGGAAIDEGGALVGVPTVRLQSTLSEILEQQDLLRPVALALPLISAHVPNATRPIAPTPAAHRTPGTAAPDGGASLEYSGRLLPGDEQLTSGEYADRYPLELAAGDRVHIALSSPDFDAYLLVLDPTGAIVFEVDDSPGAGTGVSEIFVAEAQGSYTFVATSFAPGDTGGYRLTLKLLEPEGELDLVSAQLPFRGAGELTRQDAKTDAGLYADFVAIDLPAGRTFEVSYRSNDFDPYLVILDPNDEVALEVDDSLNFDLNVVERFTTRSAGTYLLVLTSAFAGEMGGYEVELVESSPSAGTPDIARSGVAAGESGTVGPLALGATSRGSLIAATDAITFHTYTVGVPPGTRQLTLDLNGDVDVDLFVKYGSDIRDWGGGGDWDLRDIEADSRAILTIGNPRPGIYYVDVVNAGPEPAQYTLRAR